jgi:hypothetical protein
MSSVALALNEPSDGRAITLQKLGPKHKQVMSLLAQGVDRQTIAAICEITPEYVTWLAGDPLCKTYLKEMSRYVDIRFEAMYEKTADIVSEAMNVGTQDEKLKAARMQLELTGRVGRVLPAAPEGGSAQRLEMLAQRLETLLDKAHIGKTYENEPTDIEPTP